MVGLNELRMVSEQLESPDNTTIFSYHQLVPPTTQDVFRAHKIVQKYLPRTPLVKSRYLSEKFDAEIYYKREDTLPTGAFKVRGGIYLCSKLSESFREPGLIAASTGNHGLSVTYGGATFNFPTTIVLPEDSNQAKIAEIERLGGSIIQHGTDYEEARKHAEKLAEMEGHRFVHSGNEPDLIAGVGTAGIEVMKDLPSVDMIVCPIGGGSSAAGYSLTLGDVLDVDIIGVQSNAANAVYQAWEQNDPKKTSQANTLAEGISASNPFALPLEVLQNGLTDFMTVEESSLQEVILDTLKNEHLLIEGATAAAIAGLYELDSSLSGRTIVVPISGRNFDWTKLKQFMVQD